MSCDVTRVHRPPRSRRRPELAVLAGLVLLAGCDRQGEEEDPTIARPIDVRTDSRLTAVDLADPDSLLATYGTALPAERTEAKDLRDMDAVWTLLERRDPVPRKVAQYDPDTGLRVARGWLCGELQVGPWIYYHPDGRTPWHVGTFRLGGIRDGEWTSFYPNGRPQQTVSYDRGSREGLAQTWHANGRRQTRGEYHRDRRIGRWLSWHDNGKLESVGAYRNDRPWGLWIHYDLGGREVERMNYNQPGDAAFLREAVANEEVDDTRIPDGRRR